MNNRNEIIQRLKITTKAYFKGLVKLAILAFIILAIGLKIIGIDMWFLKALGIAIFDMIPVLGGGMILIPWAIIKAISGSVDIGVQIAILYLVLQIVKFIAEPLIIGKNVGLPPILTIIITVICVIILGPVGFIVSGIVSIPIKVLRDVKLGKTVMDDNDTRRDQG